MKSIKLEHKNFAKHFIIYFNKLSGSNLYYIIVNLNGLVIGTNFNDLEEITSPVIDLYAADKEKELRFTGRCKDFGIDTAIHSIYAIFYDGRCLEITCKNIREIINKIKKVSSTIHTIINMIDGLNGSNPEFNDDLSIEILSNVTENLFKIKKKLNHGMNI